MAATRERVLVTGATGFLGSALVRALAAAGHEVYALTRSAGGVAPGVIAHQGDLLDAEAVRECVRASRPAVVFHLAAAGVGAGGPVGRAGAVLANAVGTARLFDALDGHDYRALVHAGTGTECGPSDVPVPEDAPPRPVTDYAAAKAAAAVVAQTEARRGKPVAVVRIFGAYGPGEGPNRLLPGVFAACLRGEPARVSAGTQVRDWVYVGDVVDLLVLAAGFPGAVLHAATGTGHTVREAVETAVAVAGGPPAAFGAVPTRPGEPTRYLGSIEETTRLTGWRPRVGLQDGVARAWDWFRTQNTTR